MVDGVVDLGLQDFTYAVVFLLVLASLSFQDVAPVHQFPPSTFPFALRLLQLQSQVPYTRT